MDQHVQLKAVVLTAVRGCWVYVWQSNEWLEHGKGRVICWVCLWTLGLGLVLWRTIFPSWTVSWIWLTHSWTPTQIVYSCCCEEHYQRPNSAGFYSHWINIVFFMSCTAGHRNLFERPETREASFLPRVSVRVLKDWHRENCKVLKVRQRKPHYIPTEWVLCHAGKIRRLRVCDRISWEGLELVLPLCEHFHL